MKKILLMLLCVSVLGCSKNSVESEKPVDVLLIGGGIMSATLGDVTGLVELLTERTGRPTEVLAGATLAIRAATPTGCRATWA